MHVSSRALDRHPVSDCRSHTGAYHPTFLGRVVRHSRVLVPASPSSAVSCTDIRSLRPHGRRMQSVEHIESEVAQRQAKIRPNSLLKIRSLLPSLTVSSLTLPRRSPKPKSAALRYETPVLIDAEIFTNRGGSCHQQAGQLSKRSSKAERC